MNFGMKVWKRLQDCESIVNHILLAFSQHMDVNIHPRRYFGDHNIEGMFATLAPLHALLDKVNLLNHMCQL